METVQRLPKGAWAPLDLDHRPCCFDCCAADKLMKMLGGMEFVSARIATGNDRQEAYRLPGVPMGLVLAGIMQPSQPGDFEEQLAWLDKNKWFELLDQSVRDAEKFHPLPRCRHGNALRDGAGERLEPSCGCRR